MHSEEPEVENRRTSFRADVEERRELAVIRRNRREYTVWLKNVSAGGVGFLVSIDARFRTNDKIDVITAAGAFEGRVAHVTREPGGKNALVGVERVRVLDDVHRRTLDRGDLPRTGSWIPSLLGWTVTSSIVCSACFFAEISGALGDRVGPHSPTDAAAREIDASRDSAEIARRFRRIDALHAVDAAERLGLSIRQTRHVVAIADGTGIAMASLFAEEESLDRDRWTQRALATVEQAEARLEGLLTAEQTAVWRTWK